MADSKTTQLAQLAATPAVDDQLMIVDVSDTSMAASGTNKRLAASYVARSDAGAKLITGNGRELTVPATGTAALIESGSWTPGISFGNGTTGITYGTQIGKYVKVGTFVFFTAWVALTNKGSSTGQARLTGLPVTSASGSVIYEFTANWDSMASNLVVVQLQMAGSSTTAPFRGLAAAAVSMGNLTDTAFANNTTITVTGTYSADS